MLVQKKTLVNIAHMKDYVEACEASKDLAPHTLSRVEIWNWIILEHYEQLGSKYHNFWSWENGIAQKETCQKKTSSSEVW